MNKRLFGTLKSGEEIFIYTISGTNTTAEIINYGAAIQSLTTFGKDVVGGFDNIEAYVTNPGNQGGTIGRVSNRIEDACLTVDGVEYKLVQNNGKHCLHGGVCFNHAIWQVTDYADDRISLRYISHDGECGFPGELDTTVTFKFVGDDLIISYSATPSKKTPIALTNHAYFNLDGFGGDILDHKLMICADRYSEIDETILPTGNHPLVYGTIFDFSTPTRIGNGIGPSFRGYDHNFVLTPKVHERIDGKLLALAATLENDEIMLSIYTDQPGIQLYTGNGLGSPSNPTFKGGIQPTMYGGLCLETQTEPNSVKRGEGIYSPGETYTHTCVYGFKLKG